MTDTCGQPKRHKRFSRLGIALALWVSVGLAAVLVTQLHEASDSLRPRESVLTATSADAGNVLEEAADESALELAKRDNGPCARLDWECILEQSELCRGSEDPNFKETRFYFEGSRWRFVEHATSESQPQVMKQPGAWHGTLQFQGNE